MATAAAERQAKVAAFQAVPLGDRFQVREQFSRESFELCRHGLNRPAERAEGGLDRIQAGRVVRAPGLEGAPEHARAPFQFVVANVSPLHLGEDEPRERMRTLRIVIRDG